MASRLAPSCIPCSATVRLPIEQAEHAARRSARRGQTCAEHAAAAGATGGPSARAAALVRTRVEPKTFFANERTFLSWLQISVLVMMIAFALLRCGAAGRVSAAGRVGGRAGRLCGGLCWAWGGPMLLQKILGPHPGPAWGRGKSPQAGPAQAQLAQNLGVLESGHHELPLLPALPAAAAPL